MWHLALALVLATPAAGTSARAAKVGDRVHITGCGKQFRPLVKLWADRNGGLGRAIGEVSGTGKADRCAGAVVIVREIRHRGATAEQAAMAPLIQYRVETVVGDQAGWLAEAYIC